MAFIEQTIDISLAVKSQYDYSSISSNQCSWCAFEFVSAFKTFISNVSKLSRFNDNFKNEQVLKNIYEIYDKCVLLGSEKRKQYGIVPYGENITNKMLQSKYNNITITDGFYCKENPDKYFPIDKDYENEFMNIDSLIEVSREQLYKLVTNWLTYDNRIIFVNRYGQSFAILHATKDTVFICDSHCKYTGLANFEKMFKYIMFDQPGNNDGYKFCTVLLAYV